MFRVAICDDEKTTCRELEDMILAYGKDVHMRIETEVYYCGRDFCRAIDREVAFDLIFLDIELQDFTGMELGKKIRESHNNAMTQIIFISAREQYAMALFEFHPLNFLIKPLEKEKIVKNLNTALMIGKKYAGCFTYRWGHEVKKIPIKDILYFESKKRVISIMTTKGESVFYGKLDEVYEELKHHHFLYTHKSFLVNHEHVEVFHYEYILINHGCKIPISQSRRKQIKKIVDSLDKEQVLFTT